MGTASFVKQMEEMGIHLWVEDEKLKFRAPEGVVDEKIRESLKANKQAIIVYFKDRMAPVHEEEDRYDFFELTDIQASYLFGSSDAYGLGETGCTVYAVWYEKYQCYIAIRKLTPRETFRLQGWSDDYFDKAEFVNSDSQLYKQAGNGVSVPVVYDIARRLN